MSRYGISGWEEDLHPLNVGRNGHGCGSYIDNEDKVSLEQKREHDMMLIMEFFASGSTCNWRGG